MNVQKIVWMTLLWNAIESVQLRTGHSVSAEYAQEVYNQLHNLKKEGPGIIWLLFRLAHKSKEENFKKPWNINTFLEEKPYFAYPLSAQENNLMHSLDEYTLTDDKGNIDPLTLAIIFSTYKGSVAPVVENKSLKPPSFELQSPYKPGFF